MSCTHPPRRPAASLPTQRLRAAIVRRPGVDLDLPWTWLCRRRCIRGIGCPDGSTHPALVHPVFKYARPLPPPSSSRTANRNPLPFPYTYATAPVRRTSIHRARPTSSGCPISAAGSSATCYRLVLCFCWSYGSLLASRAAHGRPCTPRPLCNPPSSLLCFPCFPPASRTGTPSGRTPCIFSAARPPPKALLPMPIRR